MSRIAWRFYDPETEEIYSWEVNPYEDGGSNGITKNPSYTVMAGMHQGVSGDDRIDTLIHEANTDQSPFVYTGRIYNAEHYAIMEDWCNRPYPIHLTDDLGREFKIWVNEFKPKRVRSRQSRYKHQYTFSGIILEEIF